MIARLAVLFIVAGAALGAAAACAPTDELPANADVCARATHLFSSCGVILPTLSNAPCTGAARLVAQCVVSQATDCDGLSTITQHLDDCVEGELDGGDLIEPPADLPVPLGDDSSSSSDAGHTADATAATPR